MVDNNTNLVNNATNKKISVAVINRLPRYYRYLGDLLDNDINRISSRELSAKMNITASQIRQDLNNFGGFGQQGYGYNVKHLYSEIRKILGLDRTYNMIVVGGGNLGQALSNYTNFEKRGFIIQAIFDINPKILGLTIRGVAIYDIDQLEEYIEENKVDVAILTLPRTKATEVAFDLAKWGIKGIWNFSHVDLKLPDNVMVENVHLTDSLMTLLYKIKDYDDKHIYNLTNTNTNSDIDSNSNNNKEEEEEE